MTEVQTVKNPRNAAYNAALSALKALHEEEFQALYQDQCGKHGIEYKPRVSAEERARRLEEERVAKAKAKVEALVAEFGPSVVPDLTTPF